MRGSSVIWFTRGLELAQTFRPRLAQTLYRNALFRNNGYPEVTACKPCLFHAGTPSVSGQSMKDLGEKTSSSPVLDSLRERGLYPEDLYKHYAHLKIVSTNIAPDGRNVHVEWNDGHKSKFHVLWLRHCCHCPKCKLDHNGMLTVNFLDVDMDCQISSVELEGDEVVLVNWRSPDGKYEHKGHIPTCHLRIHCYSHEALNQKEQERAMKFYDDKVVPELDFKEVSSSGEGLYKWLLALSDQGICLLKNVPTKPGQIVKVAEMIAPIQHTIYGETFDVKSVKQPINAAYSDVNLFPHMDQTPYESPPGLQMLHCLKFDDSIVGGESMFVDVHEVAHKFRREEPEFFNALTQIPYTAQIMNYRRDFSVHMQIQRPVFVLNHRDELVCVNWHPMLVGATQVAQEDVDLFYKAYIAFYRKVVLYPSKYELRLVPGDVITFNNRRVLHGRKAFQSQEGERHLQGTYIEISEFQSLVRVLHNRYGNGRLAVRSGSMDWF